MNIAENKQGALRLKGLSYLILFFFCYESCSPALRVFLIGGNAMNGLLQTIVTIMPDILFAAVVVCAAIKYFKGEKITLLFFDKLVLFYIFFNLVYGTILSNLFIAAQGFRITYMPVIFYFIGRLYNKQKPELASATTHSIFSWFIIFGMLGLVFHFLFTGVEASLIQSTNHLQTAYFIPRMGGFFLTPVLFGTAMTITCIYFYYRLFTNKSSLNYLFIALTWACIFLSVSRGPIMAFFLGFILLSLIFKEWKKTLAVIIIIAVTSATLSLILTGSLNILTWLFSSTADTLSMGQGITRVELWRRSWHDFVQRPYGYGLGHAGATAVRYLKGTDTPAAVYTTDGWFLKIACETGIAGLLSYLALALYYLVLVKKNLSTHRYSLFSFVTVLFIMVNAQAVVANIYDFYPTISLFWLLMGYSINIIEQKQVNE